MRFGLTGKVITKADESQGVWHHINHLRQEVFDRGEEIEALDRKINGVKNGQQEKREWTESGIWAVVTNRGNARRVKWLDWAVKGTVGALGMSLLGLIVWVVKLAWAGAHVR